jgi:hypothetical protein
MIHKVIMNTMIMMNFQVPKLILLFMMNKQMMIKIYFIKLFQKIRVRIQKDSQKKRKSAF